MSNAKNTLKWLKTSLEIKINKIEREKIVVVLVELVGKCLVLEGWVGCWQRVVNSKSYQCFVNNLSMPGKVLIHKSIR